MKNFFTLFLLLSSTFTLSSQLSFENIDISKFQYADARFKSLDLSLFQSSNSNAFENYLDRRNTSNAFNLNGGLNSYNFRNTRKLQQTSNFGLNFNTQKFNSNSTFDHDVSLNWSMESRHYTGIKFWELVPSLTSNSDLSDYGTINLSFGLRRGKGRLEPVDDVYLLRWIAKDLEEEGVQIDHWDQETIFDLAKSINLINNYRLFDSRRQIKTQLKDATNLITSRLGDSAQNLDVYATIFDNFTGSIRGQRQEGSRKSIGIKPSFYKAFVGNGADPGFYGLELSAEYIRSKNTSLKLQKVKEVQTGISYYSNQNYGPSTYNFINPFVSGQLGYDYFPNSRTSISAYAGVRLGVDFAVLNSGSTEGYQRFTYDGFLRLNVNYFINYQTRVRLSLSYKINGWENRELGSNYFTGFNNQITFSHSFY